MATLNPGPAAVEQSPEDWSSRVHGPRGLAQLKFFIRTVQNYADADVELLHRYGDVVRIHMPRSMLLFFRPRHVRHILRTNVLNYPKSLEYDALRPILGEGVFVSEGQLWTRQRRLLAPEFRPQAVQRFLPGIVECVEQLFAEWDARTATGPIDISHDMMRVTLWIVGRAMFERDFQRDAESIGEGLELLLAHAIRKLLSMGLYPDWLPTRANREARAAAKRLDAVIMRIIETARAEGATGPDMISAMLRARDETGAGMTDKQLLDETKSLVLAGHETTSLTLAWGLYALDREPEVVARLVDEATRVLGDGPPSAADVEQLVYTRMVFLEIMRLYPPVPAMSRQAVADDDIDGIHIRPGGFVGIAPYATQRHPEFWPQPERFDPERFAPERVDDIEPYSYMPFLLGRRACLGEHFAMLEGVVLLAMLMRRYRFERSEHEPIASRPMATLRMARPLRMTVHARDGA